MTPNEALTVLQEFISRAQMRAMVDGCRGEEGDYFRAKLIEYAERISTMPTTYEQDGMGDAAIVHLHYFIGACDWYISERDIDEDGEGQIQAFGYANLGDDDCAELGYISIKEIIGCGAELDLHFTPCTLASIKEDREAVRIFEEDDAPTPSDPTPDPEAKRRSELEAPHFALQAQAGAIPAVAGGQSDLFGAAGLDRLPARKLLEDLFEFCEDRRRILILAVLLNLLLWISS